MFIFKELDGQLKQWRFCRVIVTSSSADGYDYAGGADDDDDGDDDGVLKSMHTVLKQKLLLAPFTPSQICEYVNATAKAVNTAQINNDLFGNPLLLHLRCALRASTSKAITQLRLFQQYVDEREDDESKAFCVQVASEMMRQGQRIIPLNATANYNSSSHCLRIEGKENTVSFAHVSFYHFFAALALLGDLERHTGNDDGDRDDGWLQREHEVWSQSLWNAALLPKEELLLVAEFVRQSGLDSKVYFYEFTELNNPHVYSSSCFCKLQRLVLASSLTTTAAAVAAAGDAAPASGGHCFYAANAISVLNYSGFSLSGMDLEGVCLAGADLQGAVICGANLQRAVFDGFSSIFSFIRSFSPVRTHTHTHTRTLSISR